MRNWKIETVKLKCNNGDMIEVPVTESKEVYVKRIRKLQKVKNRNEFDSWGIHAQVSGKEFMGTFLYPKEK
jgi:hypothetical protein